MHLIHLDELNFFLRDRSGSHFMALAVEVLHEGIVGVLVAHEEGASDGAAVGVGSVGQEDGVVGLEVQVIHTGVKCDQNYLRDLHQKLIYK